MVDIAMTISITFATLQNLGNAVSQYRAEDKFEDRVIGAICRGFWKILRGFKARWRRILNRPRRLMVMRGSP
jgi:hypothetical protein